MCSQQRFFARNALFPSILLQVIRGKNLISKENYPDSLAKV